MPGPTVKWTDPTTGETREASVFVAVLGASNYTYAEATEHRDLPAWIGSHTRALEFFGGAPAIVVPDNWKTGVKSPCFYEPDLNPTYREWAEHYQTVIIPARVRKPRDKAKVEAGVLLVERWILAALRKRTFFSLAELNQAIRELLVKLNERKFRKLDTTRARLFAELDRPGPEAAAGRAVPLRRVVQGAGQHRLPRGSRWALLQRALPLCPRGHGSAHQREDGRDLPPAVAGWSLTSAVSCRAAHHAGRAPAAPAPGPGMDLRSDDRERQRWSGPRRPTLLDRIMKSRPHPELGYRSCLGVLRLGDALLRPSAWKRPAAARSR